MKIVGPLLNSRLGITDGCAKRSRDCVTTPQNARCGACPWRPALAIKQAATSGAKPAFTPAWQKYLRTGLLVIVNTGVAPAKSRHRLLIPVGWQLPEDSIQEDRQGNDLLP